MGVEICLLRYEKNVDWGCYNIDKGTEENMWMQEEMSMERTRLHNKESHNLYASRNMISVSKWRRMIWAGHVARMGMRICTEYWSENL
jgi:hypothetical protein